MQAARRLPLTLGRTPGPRATLAPNDLSTREQARRTVVRLVFVIYVLVLAEGSLRKWVVPEFGAYIFFVRDPFLVLTYVVATRHRLWPRDTAWLAIVTGMCAFGLLLLALQAMVGGESEARLVLAVHGYRSYFLYVPLALLIGATFRGDDLARLYKLTLWVAVPIAVLVVLQFFAPLKSPINVGIASDEALQFRGLTATGERTRPMGPFSSILGQQQFATTAWAIVLGLFIAPAARHKPSLLLLAVAGTAVMVSVGLSGSRGTVLVCALTAVFALMVGALGRGGAVKGRALLWTGGLLAVALVLYPIVLPEGYESFGERWAHADKAESRTFSGGVFGRAFFTLIDFIYQFDRVPLLGHGLGYGSNAAIILKAKIDGSVLGFIAESDYSRHIVDLGPVFGVAYIGFRLAFVGWLAAMVVRVTRRVPDPMPLVLFSYVGYTLVTGLVTGQGAVTVYAWLFAGLLIAACHQARQPGLARSPSITLRSSPTRRLPIRRPTRNYA